MRVLFLGSSNSLPATGWPDKLAARHGWTVHNHAVGGGGYAGSVVPSKFSSQLQAAVTAMTAAGVDFLDVGFVFITDASNDIRGGRPVNNDAPALFANVKQTFPQARIIVVPVLWNHSQGNVENLDRRLGVTQRVAELKEAALPYGVEIVDGSWLWHWNTTQWDDGFHFSPAGYDRVATFVDRFLSGLATDNPHPWTQVPSLHPQAIIWPTRVKREGNLVTVAGSFTLNVDFPIDIGIGMFPPGCIPVDMLQLPVVSGNRNVLTTTLYPDGTWRSLSPLPKGTYWVNATFPTL